MRGSRLHAIQDFVFNKRHATLKELADRFGVSMNTVRRDVDVLLKWRAVEKVYGGVVANPHYRSYLHFGERSSTSTDEKSRIGRAAARLINRDDLLMMDAGSTVAGFAESIDQSIPLTVITNNMAVVARLAPSSAIRLIALGGEYSRSANGFVGMETIEMLRNYKANRAFFSVTGILPAEGGITNAPSIEAQIKRAMLESSQENYLMIDSSKFGVVSLVNVVPFSHIDHVITDRAPQKDYLDLFDRYEIDLIIAEQNITADRNAPSDQ